MRPTRSINRAQSATLSLIMYGIPIIAACIIALDVALWRVLPASLPMPNTWFEASLNLLSVILAFSIFVAGWFVLDDVYPGNIIVLSICFFVAGALDASHLVLVHADIDLLNLPVNVLASAYWLLARLATAIGIAAWLLPANMLKSIDARKARLMNLAGGMAVSTAVALIPLIILSSRDLATNAALNLYSIDLVSTGANLLVYGFACWLLIARQTDDQLRDRRSLLLGLVLLACSELLFAPVVQLSDSALLAGHFFKMLGTVLVCYTFFSNAISLPVDRLRQANSKLKLFSTRMDNLLSSSPDGVIGISSKGQVVYINPRVSEMFGYTRQELIGQPVEQLLPPALRAGHAALRGSYVKSPTSRPMAARNGLVGRKKDGRDLPVDVAIGPGSSIDDWYLTAYVRDMSERRQMELELEKRANFDMLTGLPNRALIHEKLSQAVMSAGRDGLSFALFMIDLDNFKEINDAWGNNKGDKLLRVVAQRLSNLLGPDDLLGRLGGDEFVLISANATDESSALHVSDKILSSLNAEFVIEPNHFSLSASIGIARFPLHAADADSLLKCADMATYNAKNSGRSIAKFFDEDLLKQHRFYLDIKTRLKKALIENQLQVYYQPQYSTGDDSIVGFEALLRWRTDANEWISPDRFIPVAESTGLIIPITEWVAQVACAQLCSWRDMGFQHPISVNVSGLHFKRDGELLAMLQRVLGHSGINPSLLGIELTETTLMENASVAAATLNRLVELGIKISIDDFGTGYSSLASLEQYPLHVIKIDKRFMDRLGAGNKAAAIVKAMIDISVSLDMDVVAEGVETDEQLNFLRQAGCHAIQGWIRQPALAPMDATRLLVNSKRQSSRIRLLAR